MVTMGNRRMSQSLRVEAWLITGIPGSGKSTIAHLLGTHFRHAAHIEGDRLQEWIVSGRVLPGQPPPDEEERQIRLCIRNQCLLARSFAEAGFIPVLDYVVVSQARLAYYRAHLDDMQLNVVVLAPGRKVALERDRNRPEKTVAEEWAHLEDEIRRELSGMGLWVDNGPLSAEQTLTFILQEQARARVHFPIIDNEF